MNDLCRRMPVWLLAAVAVFFNRGPLPLVQQERFEDLCSANVVAVIFARQHQSEMVVVGDATMRQADQRPWLCVGSVVAPTVDEIPSAIDVQRKLLVGGARAAHKKLRPLRDVSLAWALESEIGAETLTLGSFRCTNCGAFNAAKADQCINCGAGRSSDAPRGVLTMAMRRQGTLELDQCGFVAVAPE